MKEKILITSLAKVRKNAPWRVGIYLNDNYTFFNVGEKGNVATSPRFHMFLAEVEKKVSRYPVDISFYSIEKNREMEVTKIRDQIVYVDCGYTANRLIPQARFYYDKEVLSNPLEVAQQKPEAADGAFTIFAEQTDTIPSLDYVAIAQVDKVVDGDTINVTLKKLSSFLTSHFEVDQEIVIRYNGVDSPEKSEDGGNSKKDSENAAAGKVYGVTMSDMYSIADEAYKYNEKLLGWNTSQKPLVVIHFDRDKNGQAPITDNGGYGRFIADVFATQEKSADILLDKVTSSSSWNIPL
jgi:endonuclease YncB( thermonuclease family)